MQELDGKLVQKMCISFHTKKEMENPIAICYTFLNSIFSYIVTIYSMLG